MRNITFNLIRTQSRYYVETKLNSFHPPQITNKMAARNRFIKLCDNTQSQGTWGKEHSEFKMTERKEQVAAACHSLKENHIIAVPTDTIYGIAGLAQSTPAVQRIYNIKNRDLAKPIAICVGDVADIKKWGKVTISQALLSELLPGPVTIVLERTAALNPSLNPGTSLVGIRVPDCGFVREVTRAADEPLALTSANRSSDPSAVQIQEFSELWPQLDLVFDGGTLGVTAESRLGSTVVDLSKAGLYTIIRPGSAHKETVHSLKKFGLQEETKS